MEDFFSSGRFADVGLFALLVELVVLIVLWHRDKTRLSPIDVVGHLSAGGFLILALRAASTGADVRYTLALLTASFPAHLFDLARRARRARLTNTP